MDVSIVIAYAAAWICLIAGMCYALSKKEGRQS
jgi:hypothetical protein